MLRHDGGGCSASMICMGRKVKNCESNWGWRLLASPTTAEWIHMTVRFHHESYSRFMFGFGLILNVFRTCSASAIEGNPKHQNKTLKFNKVLEQNKTNTHVTFLVSLPFYLIQGKKNRNRLSARQEPKGGNIFFPNQDETPMFVDDVQPLWVKKL